MQKQATAAAAQLNGAVQTKLDALKRAADLMDESAVKLTKLSQTIQEIDTRIMHTNTVISNYEYLRRVHNVRDNVARVISNIDFFTRVPELVEGLLNTLETDPTQLKEVFVESIKLESLHSALIKELKTNKGRRESVAAFEAESSAARGRSTSLYSSSDEGQRRMIAAIEEHLGVVPELARRIRSQLWNVIGSYDQMIEVASRSPQTLVATFEIVEMHQEYMDRRIEQAQKSGELEGMDPDFIATSLGYEAISDECQNRVRSLFESHVEGTFLAVGQDAQSIGKAQPSKTATITTAATELIKAIAYFKHEVDPCFPPKYNALETFLDVFEDNLLPEAQAIMRGIGDLDAKETLRLIDWFHFYKLQVQELETGLRPSTETFEQIAQDLMDEYVAKIKSKIMQLFENARQQFWDLARTESPVVNRTADGLACTLAPQDVYKALDMSLEIGASRLPVEMLHRPILIALQCLQEYMRESYNLFEVDKLFEEREVAGDKSTEAGELKIQMEDLQKMSPELMCALVNDCSISADMFKELGEKFIAFVTQDDIKEALFLQLDEVTNFFTDLAMHATNFLARCVLNNELKPNFCAIFTEKWESGEEPVAEIIADTIYQVLELCKSNLEQFFYRKLANILLTSTIECYLGSILRVGDEVPDFRFQNDLVVASRVLDDLNIFKELFSKYEEDLTYGGLRAKPGSDTNPLEDALEPIAALQQVLLSGQFAMAEDYVKILYERYPAEAYLIVRCAIQYRPDGSMRPAEKKAFERATVEYIQRLDAVKKIEMGLAPPPPLQSADDDKPAKKAGGFFSRIFGGGGGKDK